MATPRLRIRVILANGATLDPTKIALLEAIVATGSITAAARSLEISYRYAWRLSQSINHMLRTPALVTEVGGNQRGGSKLTASGKELVAIYHAIQSQAHTASVNELHMLNALTRAGNPSTRAVESTEKL